MLILQFCEFTRRLTASLQSGLRHFAPSEFRPNRVAGHHDHGNPELVHPGLRLCIRVASMPKPVRDRSDERKQDRGQRKHQRLRPCTRSGHNTRPTIVGLRRGAQNHKHEHKQACSHRNQLHAQHPEEPQS